MREWNPNEGVACQGDVFLMKLPPGVRSPWLAATEPVDSIVLADGEHSGHRHSVLANMFEPPLFLANDTGGDQRLRPSAATVRFSRDHDILVDLMFWDLTDDDHYIGALSVEGANAIFAHTNYLGYQADHDGIIVPPGQYFAARMTEIRGRKVNHVVD